MAKQPTERAPAPNITSITYWRKFAVHRVFYIGIAALFGISAVAYFGSPGDMSGANSAERAQAAVVTVNGEPISRALYNNRWEQTRMMARMSQQPMTPIMEAQRQGQILDGLITNAIQVAAAKKQGLKVPDALIDERIELFKQSDKDGKKESTADFEKRLREDGMSLAQLRDDLRVSLMPEVLEQSIADKEKVTEEDVQKTFDEVRIRRIMFPISGQGRMVANAKPDAQAKRDADDVLAKLKGGMDFAKAADQFTKDPSNSRTDLDPKTKKPVTRNQGGLLNGAMDGWYKRGGGESKEFEEAAFSLGKGEMSGVVKAPEAYYILKVEDKRRKLPDDYAKTKADLLKGEQRSRAAKPIQDMLDAEKKSAKIVWQDPGLEIRYEFAKQPMMMMGAQMPGSDPKAQEAFMAKLRTYAEKNKDDAQAQLILGQLLERKMMVATTTPTSLPPAEREKTRNEVIAAYENALQRTEDQDTRFKLAQLYREANRPEDAAKQYEKLTRLLSYSSDPNGRFAYQQVATGFTGLGKHDQAKAALDKFQELNKKAEEDRKKQEAEQKAAAEKAATEKAAADKAAKEKAAADKKPGAAVPGSTAPPGPAGTLIQPGATVPPPPGLGPGAPIKP